MLDDQVIVALMLTASNIICLFAGMLIGRALWKSKTKQW